MRSKHLQKYWPAVKPRPRQPAQRPGLYERRLCLPAARCLFLRLCEYRSRLASPEIQEGNGEMFMFREANLVHIQGGIDGVFGGAIDKSDNCRGGGHRKAANAGSFGDGAVADIRVGVCFRKSGEIQRLDLASRADEPLVAQSTHPDAKISAVACHRGHNRTAFDMVSRHGHHLAACHYRVKNAQCVIAQEFDDFGRSLVICSYPRNGWGQLDGEEQRSRIQSGCGHRRPYAALCLTRRAGRPRRSPPGHFPQRAQAHR